MLIIKMLHLCCNIFYHKIEGISSFIYTFQDLKTYLIEQRKLPEMLLKNGFILRMACNISAALQHMHEHGYVHTYVCFFFF